jgi:menaquinone-9 beta-reductase
VRDAVVVGGGPAGASTALLLAREGLDVLLIDRARFPRDKPCGEFLTPATRPILEELGVWSNLRKEGLTEIPSMRLVAPSGRTAEYRPEANKPAGYAARRLTLDAAVLRAAGEAGVEVWESCSLRGLIRERGTVVGLEVTRGGSGRTAVRSRLVIGADGTHSLVARSLGLVRPIRRLQRVAIVSHWQGLPEKASIEMRSSGGVVCGVGPLGAGSANVTLVARTTEAARIAGRPGEYLEQSISENFRDLAEQLRTGSREPVVRTVGCFGHFTTRATAAGVLLVGDAATFVDPFTGEGIYFGLRGAELAAGVAASCLRSGDCSADALSAYDHARSELKRRYLLCGIVQSVVRTPLLMERVVRRCDREPVTLGRLMEVLGDLAPPEGVLQPAFAARLLA